MPPMKAHLKIEVKVELVISWPIERLGVKGVEVMGWGLLLNTDMYQEQL